MIHVDVSLNILRAMCLRLVSTSTFYTASLPYIIVPETRTCLLENMQTCLVDILLCRFCSLLSNSIRKTSGPLIMFLIFAC